MRCLPPCLATCPPSQPPQSPSAPPPWRPLCRIPLRPLASESLTPKAARGFCPLPTHSAHARHTARLRPSPPRAAVASQPNGLSFHLQAQARPRPPRCPQVMARQAEATDLPASILGERETLGGGCGRQRRESRAWEQIQGSSGQWGCPKRQGNPPTASPSAHQGPAGRAAEPCDPDWIRFQWNHCPQRTDTSGQ